MATRTYVASDRQHDHALCALHRLQLKHRVLRERVRQAKLAAAEDGAGENREGLAIWAARGVYSVKGSGARGPGRRLRWGHARCGRSACRVRASCGGALCIESRGTRVCGATAGAQAAVLCSTALAQMERVRVSGTCAWTSCAKLVRAAGPAPQPRMDTRACVDRVSLD